jgi:hypothetical protein
MFSIEGFVYNVAEVTVHVNELECHAQEAVLSTQVQGHSSRSHLIVAVCWQMLIQSVTFVNYGAHDSGLYLKGQGQ